MADNKNKHEDRLKRRDFLRDGMRTVSALAVGGVGGLILGKSRHRNTVWQIDHNLVGGLTQSLGCFLRALKTIIRLFCKRL